MMKSSIAEFEKVLDYSFKDKTLLHDALTHPSYMKSRFELLEFIGDRVIALVIVKLLWDIHPDDECEYANRFVALTNKNAIYDAAQKIMLEKYIQWHGADSHIRTILQDGCEAVFGAVFLDGGIDEAEKIIRRIWNKTDDDDVIEADPKNALQTWAHDHNLHWNYITVEEKGPPHERKYMIRLEVDKHNYVYGYGGSIKGAEKDAALRFLRRIGVAE